MYVVVVADAYRGQKSVRFPRELELKVVVNHPTCMLGTKRRSSRGASAHNHRTISLAPATTLTTMTEHHPIKILITTISSLSTIEDISFIFSIHTAHKLDTGSW